MNLFGNNTTVEGIIAERRRDVAEVDALRRDITFSKLIPQPLITSATAIASQKVNIVLISTVTNAVTLTLPPMANMINRVLYVKDVGGNAGVNNITVDGNGGDLIDGAATKVISTNYNSLMLYCTGEAWYIL